MVIPGLQSSTARGAVHIRSHHLVMRVHRPQHQLLEIAGECRASLCDHRDQGSSKPRPWLSWFPIHGAGFGLSRLGGSGRDTS